MSKFNKKSEKIIDELEFMQENRHLNEFLGYS
jgi:hypothetical protein